MGVETLLLLAGSVVTVAAIAIAAYRGAFGTKHVTATTQPQFSDPHPITQIEQHEVIATQPPSVPGSIANETAAATPVEIGAPMATAPIQEEAPAPFPEDSIASTGTSIPVDITAVANIASPAETAASPVLVIAAPKRRTRSSAGKKLPTSATGTTAPRRRRSSRGKPITVEPALVQAPQTSPIQSAEGSTTVGTNNNNQ